MKTPAGRPSKRPRKLEIWVSDDFANKIDSKRGTMARGHFIENNWKPKRKSKK